MCYIFPPYKKNKMDTIKIKVENSNDLIKVASISFLPSKKIPKLNRKEYAEYLNSNVKNIILFPGSEITIKIW